MTPSTFTLRLYVPHDLSDPKIAARLWKLLATPLVGGAKFDVVEKAKKKLTADSAKAAAQLFSAKDKLFVIGEHDGLQLTFTPLAPGLYAWRVFVDVAAIDGARGGEWLDWFHALIGAFPVLYGFGCTGAEFDAKHEVKQSAGGKNVSRSWPGASTAELYRFLPGVYWLTIFGAELVGHFGKAKLTKLDHVEASELAGGQISLRLDERAAPKSLEKRLLLERTLADELGAAHFYDRARDPAKLEPVPAFAKRLERLRSEA